MKSNLLLLLLLYLICESCEYLSVELQNKTNLTIRYHYDRMKYNDTIPKLDLCEKTTLGNIFPLSTGFLQQQDNWKFYLNDHPDEILRVFIFSEDSVLKYGTCEILKKQNYLKRYDLKYSDLQRMNWKIVFDIK